MKFEPLPESAREVEDIATLWASESSLGGEQAQRGAIGLIGAHAIEAAFKRSASGRRVLHLATHAFFLGDLCAPQPDPGRGIGGLVVDKPRQPSAAAIENPLLRSGLALAGANDRAAASADEEDGILTAEEISAMDLSGVQWVVLSACDTGVGEIRAKEGVFGLRRAFRMAGAGTHPVDPVRLKRYLEAVERVRAQAAATR